MSKGENKSTECLACGRALSHLSYPHGETVTCDGCGTVMTTGMVGGWDYPNWWIEDIVEKETP